MTTPKDYEGPPWCGTWKLERLYEENHLTELVSGVWVRYRLLANDPEKWNRIAGYWEDARRRERERRLERLIELEDLARRRGLDGLVHTADPWERLQALPDVLDFELPEAVDPDLPLFSERPRPEP